MRFHSLIFVLVFIIQSCINQDEKKVSIVSEIDTVTIDSIVFDTLINEIPDSNLLLDRFTVFPEPDLDSLLLYYETSGLTDKCPSNKYFNPTDSGIFVSYSLFQKVLYKGELKIFNDDYYGGLITHTYYKKPYGWTAEDTNQTFISLYSNTPFFKINDSISIGVTESVINRQLGIPIFQFDSTNVYLGKNDFIGEFVFSEDTVVWFKYGKYALSDSIYAMDSIEIVPLIKRFFIN